MIDNENVVTLPYTVGLGLRNSFRGHLEFVKMSNYPDPWCVMEYREAKGFLRTVFYVQTSWTVHGILTDWSDEVSGR